MEYRVLGGTGMQVSLFSLGSWASFGVKDGLQQLSGVKKAKEILTVARKAGVNLFDTAEVYGLPLGEAERIMGSAIKELMAEDAENWRRTDVIITTKIFWGGPGLNENGLSKKHIMEGTERSLKNLQLRYVDLLFCNRPDDLTPTATIVRAMTDVVRSGKAMSWGTSEWCAQRITEAYWIATTQGLEPPQYEQNQYHMCCRERFELEYRRMYKPPYSLGTMIWSPLASGLLTGKYCNGSIPEGSRLKQKEYEWLLGSLEEWKRNGTLDKVKELSLFAKTKFGCTMSQLALAWVARNPNVSSVIIGATEVSQIEENLGALRVMKLLDEQSMYEIDQILGNKPASVFFRQVSKPTLERNGLWSRHNCDNIVTDNRF
uniref:NADP-dependent oxidoreductase domain-containing protein n=1 Tax=Aplanochytrium stocchinoi TaxID=215587 RepID=A0A7S3UYZ1_9STRA